MLPAGKLGEYKRASKLTDEYFNSVMNEIGEGVWDERIHTKNKSTYQDRRIGICTGWCVIVCNNLNEHLLFDESVPNVADEWYVKEAEKLVGFETITA
jgi:hypothetical protein